MTTLTERLRASPTSAIMLEAADTIDELYAEKAGLEQIVAAQAERVRDALARGEK